MKLCELFFGLDVNGEIADTDIIDVCYDSRKAKAGSLFVALVGFSSDGHDFAKGAYENGARCFILEHDIPLPNDALKYFVTDTRAALALLGANFFSNPSKELLMIGITGTKGKTTTAHIVQNILNHAGIKCGIIGTVGASYDDVKLKTVNTTPESIENQRLFRTMLDAGCKAVVIEVSSLGLKFHRLDYIDFDFGIFSNLSPDHIGGHEHESYEEYCYFKSLLFKKSKTSVINIDDKEAERMIKASNGNVITYGESKNADYFLTSFSPLRKGSELLVDFSISHEKKELNFKLSVPGEFNAMNALSAICVAKCLSISDSVISEALKTTKVDGRCEVLSVDAPFTVVVDYAHNGVSLTSIIKTLKQYPHNKIITLFGSVGDRAQLRREELGTASGENSDFTIITADDPGFEDVNKISDEIEGFVKKAGGKCEKIPDRAQAVRFALSIAKAGDIVILCGKGHERFMKIKGEKVPFDEREVVFDYFKSKI